jgi:predicted ATPase/DNA-binding winged helix-turn-helix (wHTH) protein
MSPAPRRRAGIAFGRFQVWPDRRDLLADGEPIKLGGRAFDVLMALIEAPGAVVGRDALKARVWPNRTVEDDNLVAQIVALRKALRPEHGLIRTVAGRGYQFTGETWILPAATDEAPEVATVSAANVIQAPTNLPEHVTELIGREQDVADVVALLATDRLLSLTGPGGIGKTRLALAAARQLLRDFADGVWIAEFSAIADPGLVSTTVAAALGLQLGAGEISPQLVSRALAHRRVLLILDTCEHVIDAAAAMAEALLQAGSGVRIIATSREPLRTEGEQVYQVPALALPAAEAEDPWRFGAVQLFVVRSGAHGVRVSEDQRVATAIADICRQLDGIPLAIELAAARAATLGIEELAVRLDDRFRLLTGGRRTALPRHQTLRATLDWSHELLSESERVILRRVAVFVGAFSVEAASRVALAPERAQSDIVDDLSSVVAKSLVAVEVKGSVARYRLLDTTRAYALEKLKDSGEREPLLRRHAEYYRDLFERAGVEWETRPTVEWLDNYVWSIDNLRAALDWAFSPGGDASVGVTLTASAVPLWMHLSLIEECRNRVERALAAIAAGAGGDPRREMQLHIALAQLLQFSRGGAVTEVGAANAKALEIAESLGNADYQLRALRGLWNYRYNSGQHCLALNFAQKFYTLAATRPDPFGHLIGERLIGTARYALGELPSARHHFERVLAHFVAPAQTSEIARFEDDARVSALAYLARILWLQGLPDQARRTAESSVAAARAIAHAISLSHALAVAACPVALWIGDLAAAQHYVEMLRDNATRHALPRWHVFGRCYQGMVVTQRGDVDAGLRLLRAAFDEPAAAGSARRLLVFLISAASGHVGQIADGLPAIEEAIMRSERTEEHWLIAELLRVSGELLLWRDAPGAAAAAEGHFRQALEVACQQGALSWELRAATSLARLLREQGHSADAKSLLQPVYDRFTEGFETADLKTANALLDALE